MCLFFIISSNVIILFCITALPSPVTAALARAEDALCLLWDLSVMADMVPAFIEAHVLAVLSQALEAIADVRIVETTTGTLANLALLPALGAHATWADVPRLVMRRALTSPDTLVLAEVRLHASYSLMLAYDIYGRHFASSVRA